MAFHVLLEWILFFTEAAFIFRALYNFFFKVSVYAQAIQPTLPLHYINHCAVAAYQICNTGYSSSELKLHSFYHLFFFKKSRPPFSNDFFTDHA